MIERWSTLCDSTRYVRRSHLQHVPAACTTRGRCADAATIAVWTTCYNGNHSVVQLSNHADDPSDDEPVLDDALTNEQQLEDIRKAEEQQLREIRGEVDPQEDQLGRQRRQNVRVDVQLPITLVMNGRRAPGRTRDVSATGIGFSTRLPVELEQRGEVTVEFNEWRFRKAFIIRFIKPILAGSQVGVQFDALTQDERERLVKQVFDVQRQQLQGAKKQTRR